MSDAPSSEPATALAHARRLLHLEPGEAPRAVAAAAWLFLLMTSYAILKPIRDAMGVAGGVDNIKWLWQGTFVATLVVSPLFGWAVSRLPRRKFVPRTYHVVALNLVLFWALWQALGEGGRVWLGRVFYVWLSVFNLFVVSVLWSVLVDLFSAEQGKRLFGPIAVGATVGGMTGPALTLAFVESVGTPGLLLTSAVLVELGVLCAGRVMRESDAAERAVRPAVEAPVGHGAWNGLLLMLRSPFLLAIAAYVFLLTFASTMVYVEKQRLVGNTFENRADQISFFAQVDLGTQALTALLQLVLTGPMIRRLGVGFTLCALPLLCTVGFALLGVAGLGFLPLFGVFVGFDVTRNAARFALAKPAREVLFTLVGPEERYSAKNFVDTVVYRGGDVANVWVHAGIASLASSVAGVAFCAVPVSFAWTALGVWLGRRQRDRTAGARVPALSR
jgi:AAA family ATP:ADP antiporter